MEKIPLFTIGGPGIPTKRAEPKEDSVFVCHLTGNILQGHPTRQTLIGSPGSGYYHSGYSVGDYVFVCHGVESGMPADYLEASARSGSNEAPLGGASEPLSGGQTANHRL